MCLLKHMQKYCHVLSKYMNCAYVEGKKFQLEKDLLNSLLKDSPFFLSFWYYVSLLLLILSLPHSTHRVVWFL